MVGLPHETAKALRGHKAAPGSVLSWDGARWKPVANGGGNQYLEAIVHAGPAVIANNLMPPGVRCPISGTITAAYVRVGTNPAGSTLTVTLTHNGVLTTIATVNVSSGSSNGSSTGLAFSVTAGDSVWFNITAIGSTTPGSDVAVAFTIEP